MYRNYITGQTALTFNLYFLYFSIPKNYLTQVINNFVDSIPDNFMLEKKANTGRPVYTPYDA